MTFDEVISRVAAERERAAALRASGAVPVLADEPGCSDVLRLSALMEEVGEVARCLQDGDDPFEELVQVAGVAISWLQGIGRR